MKIWLETFLKSKKKGTYARHDFSVQDTRQGKALALTNFHITFTGLAPKKTILCAHWDTRPWADREPLQVNRNTPIPGANDGASGVAVLMEICTALDSLSSTKSVEIIFFDGEDMGNGGDNFWFLGSKHFAAQAKPASYAGAILIDMIGDRNLSIPKEPGSVKSAPLLIRTLWDIAASLNIPAFVDRMGPMVLDDHVPLIEKGLPAIDLIDFDYPYWHTAQDTPDKCSAESLDAVGRVLIGYLYEK